MSEASPYARARQALEDFSAQVPMHLTDAVSEETAAAFSAFLRTLPVCLNDAANGSVGPAERRSYRDLIRHVESVGKVWQEQFADAVLTRFREGWDRSQETAKDTERQSADAVVLAKSMLMAEARYNKALTEIEARLNRLHVLLELRMHADAIAPVSLFGVLTQTADLVSWPQGMRRVLYQSFDREFVPLIDGLYGKLRQHLRGFGKEAARLISEVQHFESLAEKPEPERAKTTQARFQPPEKNDKVDSTTEDMLKNLALSADGEGYTDGLLAADLLALMDKRPLPGLTQEQGWVPLQRVGLAGHFLNEVTSDPMVPKDVRNQHEALRLPLLKSAMVDDSVFTAESHPVRNMIDELMLNSATLKLSDNPETRRMTELLQEFIVQFDLSADFVRDAMGNAKPLEDNQVKRFFDLQRSQAEQRKEFVIGEAKRMVAQEIERCSFGRDVPKPATDLLDKAWAPLLTKRLLQFGASHQVYRDGLAQVDELIDLLESREPDQKPDADWIGLTKAMADALVAGGLPARQRGKVLEMLEAARRAPPQGF